MVSSACRTPCKCCSCTLRLGRTNNDVLFIAAGNHGVGKANDFYEQLKADFDYMYAEAERGYPKMMYV